jgi:hypothetical protein
VDVAGKHSVVFLPQLCCDIWILGNVGEDILVESGTLAKTGKRERWREDAL